MIKLFKNKIFIAAITIVLCLAISGVTMAVATPQSNDPVKLSVDYNTVLTEDFSGVGTNMWANYLSDENPYGATQAHFDLNAKRIATSPASVVRYMFMPHYIMFEEDEDFGEAKYNAGEINVNNDNLKAYVAQCQAYKDAGVRVMFNWGGAVTDEVYKWWGIKNVPDSAGKGTRSAPSDLKQYAEMFAKTLKYLVVDCGLTNVDTVDYHNEISMNNFAVFGDKRIIWVNFLKMCHNELKAIPLDPNQYNGATNLRDYVTIMGVDISHGYNGFEDDWGFGGDINGGLAASFYKYIYDNAKETRVYSNGDQDKHYIDVSGTKSTEWYFDYLSSHLYAGFGDYCESIDGSEVAGGNFTRPGLAKMCADMNKWYPNKFWITEWAGANNTKEFSEDQENTKKLLVANAFEVSVAGQALTHINSGMGATLMWGYWGGYIPTPLSNTQSVIKDYSGKVGESFIVQWNAAGEVGNETAYNANKSKYSSKFKTYEEAKVWGVNSVVPIYGEYGLLMRYVPKTNQSLGTVAKVLKSESSDKTNMRIAAITQTDKNNRQDITFVVESNDGSTGNREFEINVSDTYKNKIFRKFVYEYNATKFTDGVEGCSKYDANMVLNTPVAEGTLASGGKITDSVDASKHYLVIYTTLDEAQQVYFTDSSDVEVVLDKGASHEYSAIKFEGLPENTPVEYSILTGADQASITQDGKLTINSDATSNSWISVKVAATGAGVKTGEAYAISAVYIK